MSAIVALIVAPVSGAGAGARGVGRIGEGRLHRRRRHATSRSLSWRGSLAMTGPQKVAVVVAAVTMCPTPSGRRDRPSSCCSDVHSVIVWHPPLSGCARPHGPLTKATSRVYIYLPIYIYNRTEEISPLAFVCMFHHPPCCACLPHRLLACVHAGGLGR